MRKLMVTTMLSLDGVMQAPGGPEEDPSDGFAFGGWTAPFVDEEGLEAKAAELSVPFDLVLGRRTYEIFAGYWPNDPESAIGKPLNDATKYVAFSEPSLAGLGSVGPDPGCGRGRRGAQAGGRTRAAGARQREPGADADPPRPRRRVPPVGLPRRLGQGKRLFDGTIPATLHLIDSKISRTGVFMGTYEPAGEVVTGSF